VPEATAHTIILGAVQVLTYALTGPSSTYLQTIGDAYSNGVNAKADQLGITPEEVIAQGLDGQEVAKASALTQALFDKIGFNWLSKSIAGKGAYRAMKDWIVGLTGNKAWSRVLGTAAGTVAATAPEFVTGGAQETVSVAQKAYQGGKPIIPAIQEALPNEIASGATSEMVGGLGPVVGGGAYRAATSGYSPLSKAPVRGKATQRADFDVVLVADKLNNRKKLIQAMESAVKNNPEAEGQIRNQYNKQIDALNIDDAQVAETYGAMDTLPDSPAKQKADQVMAEYLTEKGVIGQPEAAAPPADTFVPPPPAPAETQPITVQVPEPPPSESEQEQKPTPKKMNFLGQEVNFYTNYIPSPENVEPGAMYSFTATSREGLPELLQDRAQLSSKGTIEVKGKKVNIENWGTAISGEELNKIYEQQKPVFNEGEGVAQPEVSTEIAPDVTPLTEPVAPGPVSVEVPSIQVQEGGENVAPVSQEAPQGEGQVGEQAVPVPAPVVEEATAPVEEVPAPVEQVPVEEAPAPIEEAAPVEQAPESPIAIRQFDAIKPTQRAKIKAFEDRNGPDAYKRMKKIKDDFENIMTKLSDKITQECP